MTNRSMLLLAALPVALAGAALGAFAQADVSPIEQPMAARDKVLVEAAFTKADGSGDGKLTRDETSKIPALGTRFDALDKDKDERLSLEEFATGVIAPQ
jgi:Ca2+-binding EF-hand superfamily protein